MVTSDKLAELAAQAAALRIQFETQWGGFRRWIALHPLSGFWSGVGAGYVLNMLFGLLF